MKTTWYYALGLALTTPAASAAIMDITFWGYDQYAGSTPYYSHYEVIAADPAVVISSIDLYDQGWGNTPGGKSSYHYMSSIENNYTNTGLARAIGWHQYEFVLNELTMAASLLVDGTTIRSGTYVNIPTAFRVFFHDYYGGVQKTVIDAFEYRLNGELVYRQDFESPTLDSAWSITRLDTGTYVSSGDPSTPYTGSGALALGSTSGGNLGTGVAFDLTSVPEPSTGLLGLFPVVGMLLRRNRKRMP